VEVSQTVEMRDRIEGMWLVGELIKELYALSNKFIDYKHGLMRVPSLKQRKAFFEQNKELTFKPRVNKKS